MFCFVAIPDHMMIVECQQYYSIILLTFNNHVISYCAKNNIAERVIKKSIYTPSLFLYKILPLNAVFVLLFCLFTYVSLMYP